MRHYNGIRDARITGIFRHCVLLAALAVYGCAQQPTGTYLISAPASQASPQASTMVTPPPAAVAPPARIREAAPLQYVVKKGDTLWDIAKHFLLDAWQWPEIWYVNDKIKNPHRIYPGDVLSLVYVDGRPRLVNGERDGDGVVRLSPEMRPGDLERAIPAIPIEAIRDFLTSSRVVTLEEMAKAPYLVSFLDPQVFGGAGSQAYVKNHKAGDPTIYSIVRMGEAYRDPETRELLGYEAIPVGTAEIRDTTHELVTADITRSVREVRPGDRLLPLEKDTFDAYFYPKAPSRQINGRIISVLDGVSQVTQYQVVTLNRGSEAGLERGDILTILQTGRVARDPVTANSEKQITLPDLEAGTLMVFKTMPKISYALIMDSTRAIHRLDKVTNPQAH